MSDFSNTNNLPFLGICSLFIFCSAWSGLPEPENPTGLEQLSKPEPESNPIFKHFSNPEKPEPE